MSVSSIPCIKTKIPPPSPSSSSSSFSSASSSSSSSSSSSYSFRFYSTKPRVYTIRSSQTEGPLRRPVASSVREPSPPPSPSPLKPTLPSLAPSSTGAPPQQRAAVLVGDDRNVITLEFPRQKAKELHDYFKQKKVEDADQGPLFGFIGKNEIANGRWAMFGFAVGMLTEYATGSD